MTIQTFSKETKKNVGYGWVWLNFILMFATFYFFLYCLFNWTFTFWLPAFFVMTLIGAHRYGTLLTREDKKVG